MGFSLNTKPRLDHVLHQLHPDITRAQISKLIELGYAKVNQVTVKKAGSKVKSTDTVSLELETIKQATPIDLKILYEDKDCVVIEKPVGVLSHSKGAFNPEATVATWLTDRVVNMSGERAGIVHRLDRATSGVMICAKNPDAQLGLQKQFSTRKTKKVYKAVIVGELKEPNAIIDVPIERNPKKPQTFKAGPNGKSAITEYSTVKSTGKFSLVKLMPLTGRTHQLRVHLSHLGHPILGDYLYGGKPADRLYLHAESLELTLPSGERKVFISDVPPEFDKILGND